MTTNKNKILYSIAIVKDMNLDIIQKLIYLCITKEETI